MPAPTFTAPGKSRPKVTPARFRKEAGKAMSAIASEAAALPDSYVRSLAPILRQAQAETAAGLKNWLANAPDGAERFTAQRYRQALLQLSVAIETLEKRLGGKHGAMAGTLIAQGAGAGAMAISHLQQEVASFAAVFGHSVRPLQLNQAAIMAKGDNYLIPRYRNSAARYGQDMGDEIRRQLAIGLASGETFAEMTNRLVGLRGPVGMVSLRGLQGSPSAYHEHIAEGLFVRYRYWAERIVRTEGLNAYNTHHLHALAEAEADDPGYQKRWDATLDGRSCPICRDLDGVVVDIDKPFPGGYAHPPAHPNDRCALTPWREEWGDEATDRPDAADRAAAAEAEQERQAREADEAAQRAADAAEAKRQREAQLAEERRQRDDREAAERAEKQRIAAEKAQADMVARERAAAAARAEADRKKAEEQKAAARAAAEAAAKAKAQAEEALRQAKAAEAAAVAAKRKAEQDAQRAELERRKQERAAAKAAAVSKPKATISPMAVDVAQALAAGKNHRAILRAEFERAGLTKQVGDRLDIGPGQTGGNGGHREWNGEIVIHPEGWNQAREFAKNVATDPAGVTRLLDHAVRGERYDRARALAEVRNDVWDPATSAEKAKAKEAIAAGVDPVTLSPKIRKMVEADRAFEPHREYVTDRVAANAMDDKARAMRMLVHEELHSFSPIEPRDYRGTVALVEEVTTEVGALSTFERHFGAPRALVRESYTSPEFPNLKPMRNYMYADQIDYVLESIESTYSVDRDHAWDMLEKASFAFKKLPRGRVDYAIEFADLFPKEGRAKMRDLIRKSTTAAPLPQ